MVNISTSQKVEAVEVAAGAARCRNFRRARRLKSFSRSSSRTGAARAASQAPNRPPRRVNSLGSGFIIDAAGIVVTNNHVIADADEITVILTDGTRLKAEVSAATKRPISRC